MEVHAGRASAVVVQRVPAAGADWFMEWQRGVTAAAASFPGYRGTDVYPPADGRDEWVVVIHFEDEKSLQGWLTSPVRAGWVEKLRARLGDFELQALPDGFGPWFAGLNRHPAAPPSWKMALTVLVALYPTVMLLTILTGPHLNPLGLAAAMLVGNALSCALLQWVVMPVTMAALGPWLAANDRRQRARSLGGLGLLLLLLAALVIAFRQVTG